MAAATSGSLFAAITALAVSSYLSLYPVLLAPPLALLTYDRFVGITNSKLDAKSFFTSFTTGLFSLIALLLAISYLISGRSFDFLGATYGVQLTLTDLTPNVGLWWYFFIEMFDPFREFFLGVFWMHMASYVGGLTIRLR